jgi:hypothetical protein
MFFGCGNWVGWSVGGGVCGEDGRWAVWGERTACELSAAGEGVRGGDGVGGGGGVLYGRLHLGFAGPLASPVASSHRDLAETASQTFAGAISV